MAHEIFGERFLNHREPAWHGLGITLTDRRVGAVEALRMMGEYSIRTEQVKTIQSDLPVPKKAVIRERTARGEPEKVLGVVGMEYQPIGPMATCETFDKAVGEPVETIGALRDGATLFITVELPRFAVKGDEIQDYLLVVNPMDGGEAAQIVRTPVRVVCANTLRMGQQLGVTQYRLIHDEKVQENLHNWLHGLYQKSVAQAKLIQEACTILADYRIGTDQTEDVLRRVYSEPKPPTNSAPREVMIKREEHRAYVSQWKAVAREQVLKLFRGEGRGMDTIAAAGTAWGLFNAFVEYEDYRWSKNPQQALESAVFGARADVKDLAFETCAAVAGIKIH